MPSLVYAQRNAKEGFFEEKSEKSNAKPLTRKVAKSQH